MNSTDMVSDLIGSVRGRVWTEQESQYALKWVGAHDSKIVSSCRFP